MKSLAKDGNIKQPVTIFELFDTYLTHGHNLALILLATVALILLAVVATARAAALSPSAPSLRRARTTCLRSGVGIVTGMSGFSQVRVQEKLSFHDGPIFSLSPSQPGGSPDFGP